jgi:dihydrofolate synthase / folylpolyglutamate synthase
LPTDGETVVVIGMLQGRDPSAMLHALVPTGVKTVVTYTAPSPRALPADEIADAARGVGLHADVADSIADALALARRSLSPQDRLVVTGSLYVVAEARPLLVLSATGRQVSDSLNTGFGAGEG